MWQWISKLLVLNVGNSRLALAAFVAGELQFVERVSLDDRSAWPGAIERAWAKIRDLDELRARCARA